MYALAVVRRTVTQPDAVRRCSCTDCPFAGVRFASIRRPRLVRVAWIDTDGLTRMVRRALVDAECADDPAKTSHTLVETVGHEVRLTLPALSVIKVLQLLRVAVAASWQSLTDSPGTGAPVVVSVRVPTIAVGVPATTLLGAVT